MSFKKILIGTGVFFITLTTGVITNDKLAKADTNANTQQGVILKTTDFNSKMTIVAPETSVVEYAYNFIGRPYVLGAAGPKTFDCSGLTQYVYARFGVSLAHYTGSQWNAGTAVTRGDLQAGDLVFFNTYGSLSHVGIYVGGGAFIHAPSSGKTVTVSSLSESYYASRYAGARRVK